MPAPRPDGPSGLARGLLGLLRLGASSLDTLLQLLELVVQAGATRLGGLALGCVGLRGSLLRGVDPALSLGLCLLRLGATLLQALRELVELGDELVPLPTDPGHLLLLAGQRCSPGGDGLGAVLVVALAGPAVLQVGPQRVVLGPQATQLDDDLVEEVVDLGLVVAPLEVRGLEALLDDVLGRQRHGFTSLRIVAGADSRPAPPTCGHARSTITLAHSSPTRGYRAGLRRGAGRRGCWRC